MEGAALCVALCLSVRPVIVAIGHVFSAPLASRMYFSARTEGRISYGHLGRTDSCSRSFVLIFPSSSVLNIVKIVAHNRVGEILPAWLDKSGNFIVF